VVLEYAQVRALLVWHWEVYVEATAWAIGGLSIPAFERAAKHGLLIAGPLAASHPYSRRPSSSPDIAQAEGPVGCLGKAELPSARRLRGDFPVIASSVSSPICVQRLDA